MGFISIFINLFAAIICQINDMRTILPQNAEVLLNLAAK